MLETILEPKMLLTIALMATIVYITYLTKKNTTASDFFVGGRSFGWFTNGSAIGGDYLSAATFLGIAGLTFQLGYDGAYYAFCFSIGLTLLAIFVAGPLRRFGAFTVADFLAYRFHSRRARLAAVIVVLAISGFYAAPQLLGAAQILSMFFGTSYEFGIIFTCVVMIFYVGIGGMKGTTINQALELWIRLGAFIVMLIAAMYGGLHYDKILAAINSFNGPITGTSPYALDGSDINFDGAAWTGTGFYFPTFWQTISMTIGLALGTIGLPHILLRFYTNPSAKAARKSALMAIGIASAFFLLAVFLGVVGRAIFISGTASEEVMRDLVLGGNNMVIPTTALALGGDWLLGLVIAGAFAAIFSNLSGLFITSSGALAHDLYASFMKKDITQKQRVVAGKVAIVILGILYGGLGLLVKDASIGHLVALAFTVAASTFTPIFILGIWWRGMTEKGAIAGLVIGLLVSMWMIFLPGTLPSFLQFKIPGIVTVPVGFLSVIVVSLLDRKVPADVNDFMKRVHSKESETA
ncbi:cation acetate symporter [Lysinibacillus sphaericus]|uniref:Cation acetate symporter n=3 Tax=Lysinibacillus TaxID=400634 RepID=A0A2S0K415_LYSSH|nr:MULTISPECIES: cation acetate symporter [Lysinibacillus]AHN20827.1 sodium transporter [Lysinibacillus varians]AVK98101.1 cation acetate symporter [Lysinibacillus sphaericus]MCS1383163.1 cation acetate symporter [Lysinibacillus sphaericus]MED4543605.1 cation acetate symporter [Lysinibacillus sphaericus]TKI19097.1 cation acetate symporter [Lysinibacillus sphaericus]